jgi:LysM repeat protein
MQSWKFICLCLLLCAGIRVNAQDNSTYNSRVQDYIRQFKELAMDEQRRSGIPAAVTLAQGIHETSAGNSELATEANNHFGIKCKKEWTGETFAHTDDAPNECFRKYSKAEDSYRDHSEYLRAGQRYAKLFTLAQTDYAGWCTGLKRCGYATNPRYPQVLMKLIEDYRLQDYTFAALEPDHNPIRAAEQPVTQTARVYSAEVVPTEDAPMLAQRAQTQKKTSLSVSYNPPSTAAVVKKNTENLQEDPTVAEYDKLVRVHGLKAFYAKKGTMLLNAAMKYEIRYIRLLELNDLPDGPLEADMYVYLEKKNAKGIRQAHTVKSGETLSQIAQMEGMQLRYLKFYNRIAGNEEPVPGATLQLQQYSEFKPETFAKTVASKEASTDFPGATPAAIPPGATRMRAGYVRKADIEQSKAAKAEKAETKSRDEKKREEAEASAREAKLAARQAEMEKQVFAKAVREEARAKEEAERKLAEAREREAKLTSQKEELEKQHQLELAKAKEDAQKDLEEEKARAAKESVRQAALNKEREDDLTRAKEEAEKQERLLRAEDSTRQAVAAAKQVELNRTQAEDLATEEKEKERLTRLELREDSVRQALQLLKQDELHKQHEAELAKEQQEKENTARMEQAEMAAKVAGEPVAKEEPVKQPQAENTASVEAPKAEPEPVITKAEEPAPAETPSETAGTWRVNNAETEKIEVVHSTEGAEKKAGQEAVAETPAAAKETSAETVVSKPEEPAKTDDGPESASAGASAPATTEPAPAEVAKTAATPPVEEPKPVIPEPEKPKEPEDEFSRLKAKLDRVVYANDRKAAATPVVAAPAPEVKKEAPKAAAPAAAKDGVKLYTVKKGDTAFKIAKAHNITMKQLLEWNNLDFESIKVGQQLKVKP